MSFTLVEIKSITRGVVKTHQTFATLADAQKAMYARSSIIGTLNMRIVPTR